MCVYVPCCCWGIILKHIYDLVKETKVYKKWQINSWNSGIGNPFDKLQHNLLQPLSVNFAFKHDINSSNYFFGYIYYQKFDQTAIMNIFQI